MVTNAASISSFVARSAALTEQQAEITRELGSGTRLTSLSNDPLAAAATVRISSDVAQAAGTLSALQTAQARMQAADAALGSVVSQLTSAVSVAVGAANGTGSGSDRSAAAVQLSGIRQSLLSLANGSFGNASLFAGTAVGSAPFVEDTATGSVTYAGDGGSSTFSAQGSAIVTSINGAALFGNGASSVFSQLQDVITGLESGNAPTTTQVTGLRDALQTVINGRSALGANARRLQDTATYTSTQQMNLKAQQSSLAASDPVALATELSASEAQRSALLSSLAIIGKGSLFDYL